MDNHVAATAIDFLARVQIVAEHAARGDAISADHHVMGRKSGPARQTLPVDVVFHRILARIARALTQAQPLGRRRDHARHFVGVIEQHGNAVLAQPGIHPPGIDENRFGFGQGRDGRILVQIRQRCLNLGGGLLTRIDRPMFGSRDGCRSRYLSKG